MKGDATLFARGDGVEAAWYVVQPILETPMSLHEYEPNTWGPREADRLIEGGCTTHPDDSRSCVLLGKCRRI